MEFKNTKTQYTMKNSIFNLKLQWYFANITMNNKKNYSTSSVYPEKSYSNADVQKIEIFKDNRNKSGVYRWTNLKNGKSYVGSAVDLSKRLYIYYNLNLLEKSKMAIAKAILKYGYSSFKLEILEYCDPKDCLKREQYYIDLLNPEYNILKTAGSSFGYKHE